VLSELENLNALPELIDSRGLKLLTELPILRRHLRCTIHAQLFRGFALRLKFLQKAYLMDSGVTDDLKVPVHVTHSRQIIWPQAHVTHWANIK